MMGSFIQFHSCFLDTLLALLKVHAQTQMTSDGKCQSKWKKNEDQNDNLETKDNPILIQMKF